MLLRAHPLIPPRPRCEAVSRRPSRSSPRLAPLLGRMSSGCECEWLLLPDPDQQFVSKDTLRLTGHANRKDLKVSIYTKCKVSILEGLTLTARLSTI